MAKSDSTTPTDRRAMDEPSAVRQRISDQLLRLCEVRLQLLIVFCCLSWGLTAGILVWRPAPVIDDARGISAVAPSQLRLSDGAPDGGSGSHTHPVTAQDLHLVDVMMTHGNVTQALASYSQLTSEPDTALHQQLMYRIAIARENLQQFEQAAEVYQQLSAQAIDPSVARAARLGQVRVWVLTGRLEYAKPAIARLGLELSDPRVGHRPPHMMGEVAHLLALSSLPDQLVSDDLLLHDRHVISAAPRWTPADLIEFTGQPSDDPDGREDSVEVEASSPPSVEVIYRYGDHPAEVQLRIAQPRVAVADLLNAITNPSQISISWLASTRAQIDGHTMGFRSGSISMAVALDQILGCFDLMWLWDSGTVRIQSMADAGGEQRRDYMRESAARQLRHAIAVYPDHALAQYSYLALGNLDFHNDALTSALAVYEQFEHQFPNAFHMVVAQFNAAKTLLLLGRHEEALSKMFVVADGTHGHALQSSANVYAGRLLLEMGRTADAVRPLMRAVSTAPNAQRRVVPVLTLGSAYLMADNPQATTRVLMEERLNIRRDSHVALADFLASYSRYRAARDDQALTQHGRSLIHSLGKLNLKETFGSHLYLLVGQALYDTGFTPQLAELYTEALQMDLTRFMRREVQMQLVNHFLEGKRTREAQELLGQAIEEASAADDDSRNFRHGAMVQMATILADHEGIDMATSICRDVLKSDPTVDLKRQALHLLGRLYERQGKYYEAAICFSGMLPEAEFKVPTNVNQQAAHTR